mmetsp:Transcript_6740/g.20082  ORF Transcript_6740/g.20082 Transcript_6740/m.20082 type:complete len:201 (+) Transcript_6740:758-1360(+)
MRWRSVSYSRSTRNTDSWRLKSKACGKRSGFSPPGWSGATGWTPWSWGGRWRGRVSCCRWGMLPTSSGPSTLWAKASSTSRSSARPRSCASPASCRLRGKRSTSTAWRGAAHSRRQRRSCCSSGASTRPGSRWITCSRACPRPPGSGTSSWRSSSSSAGPGTRCSPMAGSPALRRRSSGRRSASTTPVVMDRWRRRSCTI